MTPSARLFSATTNGVPPERAIVSTLACTSFGIALLAALKYFVIASAAPLRIIRPSKFTPDILVWALNGTNWAWLADKSRPRSWTL